MVSTYASFVCAVLWLTIVLLLILWHLDNRRTRFFTVLPPKETIAQRAEARRARRAGASKFSGTHLRGPKSNPFAEPSAPLPVRPALRSPFGELQSGDDE